MSIEEREHKVYDTFYIDDSNINSEDTYILQRVGGDPTFDCLTAVSASFYIKDGELVQEHDDATIEQAFANALSDVQQAVGKFSGVEDVLFCEFFRTQAMFASQDVTITYELGDRQGTRDYGTDSVHAVGWVFKSGGDVLVAVLDV